MQNINIYTPQLQSMSLKWRNQCHSFFKMQSAPLCEGQQPPGPDWVCVCAVGAHQYVSLEKQSRLYSDADAGLAVPLNITAEGTGPLGGRRP